MRRWLVVCLFLYVPAVSAGIGEDLKHFFNKTGMKANISTPDSYQDQAAGYYTGGSLSARNSVRDTQLLTVQMPGYRAGCGGIDAWTGGFSHIKSQELIQMLRNIGSSATSYSFLLAIQTVSPQIYNIMNELNALATQANHLNVNSCEAAATMLGGLWPKSDQASKHLCESMGNNLGVFSDWSAARQGCGAKGDRDRVFRERGTDPRYKDMLVGEFNLAWKALQLNPFLVKDQELSQLFMTLVGSIISRQQGENYQVRTLPGHADRDDVLTGLLLGGQTPVYRCDSELCLNPTLLNTQIPATHGLLYKVHATLESLITKIYVDDESSVLTEQEKGFLNATQLPVYKMLNVATAYRRGAVPLDIHQYGDLIAMDILYQYVIEVIDVTHKSVSELKSVQVDDSHIERFLKQLSTARSRITERRKSAFQQMDNVLSFVKATQVIEKQLHVMLGNVANTDVR